MDEATLLFLSRPADRSFKAFRSWLTGIFRALGSSKPMSKSEWSQAWRYYWADDHRSKPKSLRVRRNRVKAV